MAVSWNSIYADVLAQINSLDATTLTILQTAYDAAVAGTIVNADMNSTDWATGQIQAAIFDSEYDLAKEICFSPFHPERGAFLGQSGALSSGAPVPSTTAGAVPFLGVFDFAKEVSSGLLMTKRPMVLVQAAIRNAGSAFSAGYRPLCWCIAGATFLHNSSATAFLLGTALARNGFLSGNIRIADYHRPAIVAGAMMRLLGKEGANQEAFSDFSGLYNAHVAQIRSIGQAIGSASPSYI